MASKAVYRRLETYYTGIGAIDDPRGLFRSLRGRQGQRSDGVTQVRAVWEWIDNAGGFLRATNWVFSTVGMAALEAALQADSNAVLQYVTNGIPTVSTATPGTGTYNLTSDLAVLVFATAGGSNVRVVVPGPLVTTFGAGSNVVNPLDPATAALIAAVIGTLGDAAGNVVTGYVSGVKSSRKVEQE